MIAAASLVLWKITKEINMYLWDAFDCSNI